MRDSYFAEPEMTVKEAAELLSDLDLTGLPVGTPSDMLGVVTQKDLLVRVLAEGHDPRLTTVRQVMSSWVHVCGVDDKTGDAAEEMRRRRISMMPVIDYARTVVGIVTLSDLERDPAEESSGETRGSILLVEDEEDVRQILGEILRSGGFRVAEAGTCGAAMHMIEGETFSLVLTDVRLPDGSGIDVAEAVSRAGTPSLVVTGDANQMQRLELRGQAYLPKPFRTADLLRRVEELFDGPRSASNGETFELESAGAKPASPLSSMARWLRRP
jgi:CheY-like chemotaxis protein